MDIAEGMQNIYFFKTKQELFLELTRIYVHILYILNIIYMKKHLKESRGKFSTTSFDRISEGDQKFGFRY